MNVTKNLKLPQYTGEDIFDLQDVNKAYDSIDKAYGNIDDTYKEVVNIKDEIPKTNATAEVISARGGKETLGKRLDEFGSQLDTKANKNEIFSMANMGQDIKEAMTGGSVAVVGENAILNENLTLECVRPENLEGVSAKGNIYNPLKILTNTAVTGSTTFTVATISNSITVIHEVKPNTQYQILKTTSTRFRVHGFESEPSVGSTTTTQYVLDDNATSRTFTTGENINYISIYLTNNNTLPSKINLMEGAGYTDFTGLEYDIPLASQSVKGYSVIGYDEVERCAYKNSSAIAFGQYLDIKVLWNKATSTLTNVNAINIINGNGSKIGRSLIIPSFSLLLNNFEMIYLKRSEIEALISQGTNTVPVEKIYKKLYYSSEWFDTTNDIPLFWRSRSTVYNSLNINILTQEHTIYAKQKNIAWFGDSISELKKLPHTVGELTNFNVFDCSFAGSVMTYHPTNLPYQALGFKELVDSIVANDFTKQENAITQIETEGSGSDKRPNFNTLKGIDFNNIDIICVLYGTNDFGANITIGNGSDLEAIEFKSGMRKAIENLLTKYPHLQLYFISPIWRGNGENSNSKGHKLIDYVNCEKEVCEMYNVPFYDLYHNSNINNLTKSVWLTSDKLHQTTDGDNMLAEKCARFILSN